MYDLLPSTGSKDDLFQVVAVNRAGKSKPSESTLPQVIKSTKVPPKINKRAFGDDGKVTVKVNQQLALDVKVEGAPVPETSWWLGDQEVKSDPDKGLKVNHSPNLAKLLLIPAKRAARGKYTLKAKNQHGEDQAEVDVQVLGRPGMPQGPLEVADITKRTCTLSWKPPSDDGGYPIETYEVGKFSRKLFSLKHVLLFPD